MTQGSRSAAAAARSRLERLLSAFRERDWTAIGIEFAVVTLGVLLAFQIDQWGQDRRQSQQERQFLERMWRETDQAIRENDWVISLHARSARSIQRAVAASNDPAALARFAATPLFGCGADSMVGLGFNDTSYQELSSSGDLNIISDPEVRTELRAVAAAQADAVAQLNYSRQTSIPNRQAAEPYYTLGFDRDGNRTCNISWPELIKDRIARNAMVRANRNHVLMWWKRAYTRDLLAKVHNQIACKLGKPDCLQRVPQIVGRRNYSDIIPPSLSRIFNETADKWPNAP